MVALDGAIADGVAVARHGPVDMEATEAAQMSWDGDSSNGDVGTQAAASGMDSGSTFVGASTTLRIKVGRFHQSGASG